MLRPRGRENQVTGYHCSLSLSLLHYSPPLPSTPSIYRTVASPFSLPVILLRRWLEWALEKKKRERELRGITTRGRRIIFGMHVPPLHPSLLFLSPRWQTAILIHRSAMLAIFFMRQPLFPTGTSPKGGWIVRGQDYLSSRERFVYTWSEDSFFRMKRNGGMKFCVFCDLQISIILIFFLWSRCESILLFFAFSLSTIKFDPSSIRF